MLVKKKFGPQKYLGSEDSGSQKDFWSETNFKVRNKFLFQKHSGFKIFLGQKEIVGPEKNPLGFATKFWSEKKILSKKRFLKLA